MVQEETRLDKSPTERHPISDEPVPFRFSPRPNRANAIQWHQWGDQPFALAVDQDKPVLLAISATWCHWCHVMDETTYSDEKVIELINRDFIPVRVDTDLHPEVNEHYNMGGWPTVAILTPGGDVVTGDTYVPPPSMLNLLARTRDYYYQHKVEVGQSVLERQRRREMDMAVRKEPGELSESIIDNVMSALSTAFDPDYGGFGQAPKFPPVEALEFLLHQHHHTGHFALLHMVTKTLDAMKNGAIWDREEGGFFRYATRRTWGAPHYEKILDENARLLLVYLHAYQLTDDASYLDVIQRTMEYWERTLYDPKRSAFRGSQDADQDYYRLTATQRTSVRAPGVDPVVYTSWNAAAVVALLQVSYVLDDPTASEMARRIIESLWQHCYQPGEGMAHYYLRSAGGNGLLTDQLWMAKALLYAYEALSEPTFLERAKTLAKVIESQYADADEGGFYGTSISASMVGALRYRQKPLEENALASDIFLRLAQLTADDAYRLRSTSTLRAMTTVYQKHGYHAARYAAAVQRALHPPAHIVVVGEIEQPTVDNLRTTALKYFVPARYVQCLAPTRDADHLRQLGIPSDQTEVAYACGDQRCSPPLNKPELLTETIEGLVGPVEG